MLAEALELRARSRFGLGDQDGAKQDFVALLKANPGYAMTGQVSPRVVAIFDEAKKTTVTTLKLSVTPPMRPSCSTAREIAASGDVAVLVGPHTLDGQPHRLQGRQPHLHGCSGNDRGSHAGTGPVVRRADARHLAG